MIFKPRSNSPRFSRFKKGYAFEGRAILHVLEDDLPIESITNPLQEALGNQQDVYIERAELDLRNAFQVFNLRTHVHLTDLPTAVALNLPENLASLIWVLNWFFDPQNATNPNIDNLIGKRNHEARLLFKALAKVDLDQWYDSQIDKVAQSSIPPQLTFPQGHPIVRGLYRHHPLPGRQHLYLPINDYFRLLRVERRQELIQLLVDLGAREIKIEDLAASNSPPQVMTYPARSRGPVLTFDTSLYPWYPHESSWQTLVQERLSGQSIITPLVLTLDYSGLIAQEMRTIERFVQSFESLTALDYERYFQQIARSQRISVQFD